MKYTGREAHAGASPETGINALNAAMIGLMSIHAQRETFRDQDHIRVSHNHQRRRPGQRHTCRCKDGNLRKRQDHDAIRDASLKVTRVIQAGAYALPK